MEVRLIGASRRVAVSGTGWIGPSVALALRERGDQVWLADRDPVSLRLAVEIGAGRPLGDHTGERLDVAVIAVPPAAVAATLLDAQKRDLARVYTDVAS